MSEPGTRVGWRKIALVVGIAVLVLLFFLLDLHRYLTLSYLKASRAGFQAWFEAHPAVVLGGYSLVYVLVTALNLPGAAVMTLAGGALFGFWTGLITVSFASSVGATLACFTARYLFQGWVQDRFRDRLTRVNRGVEKEGGFYLFTLRLIPVVPFFVINLVMGLTRMPLLRFYWVSQVGMLPGTAVYVNAGKELGRIQAPADVLSPSLILSFVFLGVFPLIARKAVNLYRRRTGRGELDPDRKPDKPSTGRKGASHDDLRL